MSQKMSGKVVVITGATSGIGQVAAERLAAMGARIVQVARDRERGEEAMRRLKLVSAGVDHAIHYADLSVIGEMKRVGAEVANREPRIDVLVNNAGVMFGRLEKTSDGLERTFALNHVSYFVLTHCLLERLKGATGARVVNTASDAHKGMSLDFDDLQGEKTYADKSPRQWVYGGSPFKVYGRSKLCNILFTRELARRLSGTGVTANCLHPGFVNTRFADATGGRTSRFFKVAKKMALTPEQGSETIVYLASSDEVAGRTGEYFVKCRVEKPSKVAQDDEAARRLWEISEKLAAF